MNNRCFTEKKLRLKQRQKLDQRWKMRILISEPLCRLTNESDWFNLKLLSCVPGIRKHVCLCKYPGSFVEELYRGVTVHHVILHLIVEGANTLGVPIQVLTSNSYSRLRSVEIELLVKTRDDGKLLEALIRSWINFLLPQRQNLERSNLNSEPLSRFGGKAGAGPYDLN